MISTLDAIKTMKCSLFAVLFLVSNCMYLADVNGNFISFDQEEGILHTTNTNLNPLSFRFIRKKDPRHINIRKGSLWVGKKYIGRERDRVVLKNISKNKSPDLFEMMKSTENKAAVKFRNKNKCIVSQNGSPIRMGSCNHINSQFYRIEEVPSSEQRKDADQANFKNVEEILMNFGDEIATVLPELVREEVNSQNESLMSTLTDMNRKEPLRVMNEKKKFDESMKSVKEGAEPEDKTDKEIRISKREAQKLLDIVNRLAQKSPAQSPPLNKQYNGVPSNFSQPNLANGGALPPSGQANVSPSSYSPAPNNFLKAQNDLQPNNTTNNMGSPLAHDRGNASLPQPNPAMASSPLPSAGQFASPYPNQPVGYYPRGTNQDPVILDLIKGLVDSKDPALEKQGLQLAVNYLTNSSTETTPHSELLTKVLLLLKPGENKKDSKKDEEDELKTKNELLKHRLDQLEIDNKIQKNNKIVEAKNKKPEEKKKGGLFGGLGGLAKLMPPTPQGMIASAAADALDGG